MITTLTPRSSPSDGLSADLFRIAETADRFERPRAIEIAVERFAASSCATRAADARVTRRLDLVATPIVAIGLGFLVALAL